MKTSRTSTVTALFLVGFTTCCAAFTVSTTSTPTLVSSPQPLQAHARRSHTYSSLTTTTTTTPTSSSSSSSVQNIFRAMDKDGNGKIDATELVEYLVQTGPYTKAVAQSIFERLDVRQNGHLGWDELEQAMNEHNLLFLPSPQQQVERSPVVTNPQKTFAVKTKTSQNKRHHKQPEGYHTKKARQFYLEQAKRFFQAIDANRDGVISMAELKEHFLVQRMQAVAQSTGLMIMTKTQSSSDNNRANKNKNSNAKSVAWHHSEAAIQKLFDGLDVDADGLITLTELRDAFVRNPSVRHAFQAS